MRAVIQRTYTPAKVIINSNVNGKIEKGLIVFLGVEDEDDTSDIQWLAKKIVQLRIFSDEDGKLNNSVQDINGQLLVISQFTLYAKVKKGNRPSFIKSAKPEFAQTLYEQFISHLRKEYTMDVACGIFGADMKVHLINDGPVTIIIDSKNKDL